MNKKTVIIIPLANEESTISAQIEAIASLSIKNLEAVYVMDSYSKDRTRPIIENYARRWGWVHPDFFEASTGVVSCYLYGLKRALALGADYIIEMDGGLRHDPVLIPLFLKKLDEGYDCVFGSRFMSGGGFEGLPWQHYVLSRYEAILSNMLLGTRLSDMTSGCEAFARNVIERIDLDHFLARETKHFYQTEIRYYCHQLKVCEVPTIIHGSSTEPKSGEEPWSLRTLRELRRRAPIKPNVHA